MVNYEHYTYRLTWSVEDQEYIGLCAEFPSLSYLDENREAALVGITNLVKEVVADLEANGESLPEPLSEKPTAAISRCAFPQNYTVIWLLKLQNKELASIVTSVTN